MWMSSVDRRRLLISGLLVMAFHHRLPARLSGTSGYRALLAGAVKFFEAFVYWQNMDPELRGYLAGDTVATSREADQDVVRLVRGMGWSPTGLIAAYRNLAYGCAAGIAGHVGWSLLDAWLEPCPVSRD